MDIFHTFLPLIAGGIIAGYLNHPPFIKALGAALCGILFSYFTSPIILKMINSRTLDLASIQFLMSAIVCNIFLDITKKTMLSIKHIDNDILEYLIKNNIKRVEKQEKD